MEENKTTENQAEQLPEEIKLAHELSKDSVGRKAAVLTTVSLPVLGVMAVGRAVKEWTAWNIFGKRK